MATEKWVYISSEVRSFDVGNLDIWVTWPRNLAAIGFATFRYVGKLDIWGNQVRYLMRGINGEKLGLKCLNVGKILTI